jgi:GMP synthase (glutamine-hydrolysing)
MVHPFYFYFMEGIRDDDDFKPLQDLKILLIQLRKDLNALPAEQKGFIELSGLREDQFEILDAYRKTNFTANVIDEFDGIMVGGLSDDPSDSVEVTSHVFPFLGSFRQALDRMVKSDKPGLLSCGGFMLASVILGGRIEIDPQKSELGVVSIYLTELGKRDPLLKGSQGSFKAVSGHIKSTVLLPPNSGLLAYSDKCPVHAFRINSAPVYAFQFHPEITCADLESRVEHYKDKYFDSHDDYVEFLNLMDDTSTANRIVRRFVELVGEHSTKIRS